MELVKDLLHVQKISLIVKTKPLIEKTARFGYNPRFGSLRGFFNYLFGGIPDNLSIQTTQSTTTYEYKNNGKTVNTKSNYLLVYK